MTQQTKPQIFTFNCRHRIGILTKKSEMVEQPKCPVCDRFILEEIGYSKVELEIDTYNGEDMFKSRTVTMVTEKLHNALQQAGIKGYAPLKVSKVRFKYSEVDLKTVPNLVYLAVLSPAVGNIPIAYDYTGRCEACKQYHSKYNEEKSVLINRKSDKDAAHLQVYYDSWEGADIFNLADHGELGVTQKFLDVLKDFNCPDLVVIPAEWI